MSNHEIAVLLPYIMLSHISSFLNLRDKIKSELNDVYKGGSNKTIDCCLSENEHLTTIKYL